MSACRRLRSAAAPNHHAPTLVEMLVVAPVAVALALGALRWS